MRIRTDWGQTPSDTAKATRQALFLMLASAAMFGAMAFSAKIASSRISGAQVALIRFSVGILPCLLIPRFFRATLKFKRVDLLFYRGFFGGFAVLLYFLAIEHTSVGLATLLNYSAPIFSGLFSVLFIGERFSARVLIPLPIALAGVFLVVSANSLPGDIAGFGVIVGLASAVCSGAAVTAMRAARRTENSWAVYGSLCLLGIVTTAPMAVLKWTWPRENSEWIALGAMSLFAIGAQLLLTFSLRWIDAVTGGVISQIAVIISMALGAIFLGEEITAKAAIGSALAIGGIIGVVYATSLSRPTEAEEVVTEI